MSRSLDQSIAASLTTLLTTYHELNPPTITNLTSVPSPLEFHRSYVAQNRPFVVRGGCASWPAVGKWDAEYLKAVLGEAEVNVAITPSGNADAVVELPDGSGRLAFAKPLERAERFADVLQYITGQERELQAGRRAPGEPGLGPVKYAQTQNDNLRGEYASLFSDVPASVPFARIALDKAPDAVNFWLGNSRSVTALHKDNYENVYAQIRGRKHFVLLPPAAAACVNERSLPGATYASVVDDDDGVGGGLGKLEVRLDGDGAEVPVATWDPDAPGERATRFSGLARPMRVTLEEGDLLYLPAMWFHKVGQSCGKDGFCCAVNYWYDMEFGGAFWSANAFIREVGNAIIQNATDEGGGNEDE